MAVRLDPAGRLIQAYGDGGFRIGGRTYRGSVLVTPDGVEEWPISAPDQITSAALEAVTASDPPPELLVLGSGTTTARPSLELIDRVRARGIALEVMDTGAACRTINVLLQEDRRIAAVLLAVA